MNRPGARSALSEAMGSLASKSTAGGGRMLLRLPPSQLEEDPDQPRKTIDQASIEELAATFGSVGILSPLIVLMPAPGRPLHRIVDGHRRYRAALLAGLETVPVVAAESIDDVPLVQLVINLQREDVSAIETAAALKAVQTLKGIKRQDELGALIGKSATWISRHLSLLDLPPDVASLARDGVLKSYTRLNDVANLDASVRDEVVALLREGKSYEEALLPTLSEAIERKGSGSAPGAEAPQEHKQAARQQAKAPAPDPDVQSLQNRLSESLGSAVKIKSAKGGKGSLTISFASLDALEGIIEKIEKGADL